MLARLSVLAARPRHTLGALAVVLAAVGVAVGSGANFTAHVASANNTFASGTLHIDTPTNLVFSATDMKPGDVRTGTVDVKNTGTVSGDFSLSGSNPQGDTGLLSKLDLVIQDCGAWGSGPAPTCSPGSTEIFHNSVSQTESPANPAVNLGHWNAGEEHRYLFTVTLPANTDDTFQGLSATVDFDWNAVSG